MSILEWVILPLLAACFALYFEAVSRQSENDQMSKLKDHERSWYFDKDRAFRKTVYKWGIGLAAVFNVTVMVWSTLVQPLMG